MPNHKLRKNILKSIAKRRHFSRFLRILGPGIVTGAADDDPGGIATYSQAGAAYGYNLLWTMFATYPLLLGVQESCARIGAITGKGLAAVIKDNYSKKMLALAVMLVVIANSINIGADLGGMAAALQLLVPIPFGIAAVLFTIVVLLLEIFISYKTYAKILKWLAILLFAYPVTAFIVGQPWGEVVKDTFIPQHFTFSFDSIYLIVGLIGTTISPYLFFWEASEVREDEIAKHRLSLTGIHPPKITKHFLRSIRIDNFAGMTLSNVTAWFIMLTCATVLFSHGITQINSAADAAKAIEPLVQQFPNAGLIAKLIFSLGIIGLGLLAVPVLAGSSSYALSESLGWKEGLSLKFRKALGFYVIIIIATIAGLAINFLGINPIHALVFSAVFNGVAAVPLLFMLYKIGNNEKIMGEYKNKLLSNLAVGAAFVLMLIATLMLLIATLFKH